MPDTFSLAGIPSLVRLRTPELQIAVADDGDDAKGAATMRLSTIARNLAATLDVIDAVDARAKLRRPVPAPAQIESLQSLVRRGRRRLEHERLTASRSLHDAQAVAVTKLQAVLGT